jgi:hypothetical protein
MTKYVLMPAGRTEGGMQQETCVRKLERGPRGPGQV